MCRGLGDKKKRERGMRRGESGPRPGYGPRAVAQRAAGSLADDDINKSSAPRGGGSVGRGALNLPLRGFTYRRPQTAESWSPAIIDFGAFQVYYWLPALPISVSHTRTPFARGTSHLLQHIRDLIAHCAI